MGPWLAVNGEAIYGTRPWNRAEGSTTDGTPVRFTSKPESLFAILMEKPRGAEILVRSLKAPEGMRIEMLGDGAALDWEQDGSAIKVKLPRQLPDAPAFSLEMTPRPADLPEAQA